MDSRLERFYQSLEGKTVAFCGIGRSHEEMIRIFCEKGAKVTVRDRRNREALGNTADKLEGWGAQLILGEDYLKNLHDAGHEIYTSGTGRSTGGRLCGYQ